MHNLSQMRGGGLPAAFGPLASLAAIIGTILFGPSIWPQIHAPAWLWLASQYDHQTAVWLAWAIRIGTFPLCYFVIRLALIAGFTALAASMARRLL